MPHFMLSWQDAALIGVCLATVGWASRPWRIAAPLTEAAVLFWLYALWQFAGSFTAMSSAGGPARGRWLWHLERTLRLPTSIRPCLLCMWGGRSSSPSR